jgi:hypothetical protein
MNTLITVISMEDDVLRCTLEGYSIYVLIRISQIRIYLESKFIYWLRF